MKSQSPRIARPERWLHAWDAARPVARRRARKPTLAAALKQASKAGQHVSGAVIEDGKIELKFGEQTNNEPNPWERAMQGPKE
jgi:hypothetical protein